MKKISVIIDDFYSDEVILGGDKISELIDKKNKNIERLQDGIKKYNEESNSNYRLIENVTQGSVAMCTTIDPEYDDFDIDVGIIFNKDNISYSTDECKDLIISFLKPYNYLFNKNPQKKKNCIRINYEENYHVDLAIYRKNGDFYEHCGERWTSRNPRSINKWFEEKNLEYNNRLRIMTRLLKYFAKSRREWKLCGGLIITILVAEQLEKISINESLDVVLLNVIRGIINRLNTNIIINNPTNGDNIVTTGKSQNLVKGFRDKLKAFVTNLNVSYDLNDENMIRKSWDLFFNTKYFTSQNEKKKKTENNEMFIDDLYQIDRTTPCNFEIRCQRFVSKDPNNFIKSTHINCKNGEPFYLNVNRSHMLCFSVETNISKPYSLLWKVKNNGATAYNKNELRGELCCGNDISRVNNLKSDFRYETIDFEGNHYVECYLIKDNKCIASAKFNVNIKK